MSAINTALSDLAKKQSASKIEAAHVPKVKTRSPWVWVLAGFALSLTVGGWAVTQSVPEGLPSESASENRAFVASISPTQKMTPQVTVTLDEASTGVKASTRPSQLADTSTPKAGQPDLPKPEVTAAPVKKAVAEKPILLANNSTSKSKAQNLQSVDNEPAQASMVIQQVELTPEQLAANAKGRAKKALDSNDLSGALAGYTEVLRYTPRDEKARKKLAVLYFGKGDTRKAYELLQDGIKLNNDSEALRLSLSKLLIKANQSEAALSPLVHLPPSPSKDYLAMRAVLSQKSQQEEIALESYQHLVKIDEENARWWLGLAIQQERQFQFSEAKNSYQQALTRVGISSQSQTFVRDRLKIIKDLEEAESAN